MALSMNIKFDPPSGSYSAPVKISLLGPEHAIQLVDANYNSKNNNNNISSPTTTTTTTTLLPNNWHISVEHIDRIDEVFEGPEIKLKGPTPKTTFVYDGPFRVSRAGKVRICAWPQGGSYDADRLVAIYYIDNPENAAASRGWVIEKAPPSSVLHPLTSFSPFSFELSAAQRYLVKKKNNKSSSTEENRGGLDFLNNENTVALSAEMRMTWSYDRQLQQQEIRLQKQQQEVQNYRNTNTGSSSSTNNNNNNTNNINHPPVGSPDEKGIHMTYGQNSQTPTFVMPTTIKAEVSTTWEWSKGIRWSNDSAETVEERYCIRVAKDCGFSKTRGIHGEFDAMVTTEAALPVPVQLDVTPLAAVNAVIGIHAESVQVATSNQWKEMECSLHLGSLSGSGENPEVIFRFFSHHHNQQQQSSSLAAALKEPLIEGEVPVGSTLSFRVVPDTSATGALLLSSNRANSSSSKTFCEVRLYLDGVYLTSAFFPKKSQVRATCILSDPVGVHQPALQIVPRAPTTHLKFSNIFFGAAPLQSVLEQRRAYVKRMISQDLNNAKATVTGYTDVAHSDQNCAVLYVDLRIDLAEIESLPDGVDSASVSVNCYWRPTWVDGLPMWTVKCLATTGQTLLRLFSLSDSGRGQENFEEAGEKSKQSKLIMQL